MILKKDEPRVEKFVLNGRFELAFYVRTGSNLTTFGRLKVKVCSLYTMRTALFTCQPHLFLNKDDPRETSAITFVPEQPHKFVMEIDSTVGRISN
jgi:hypothetical protein